MITGATENTYSGTVIGGNGGNGGQGTVVGGNGGDGGVGLLFTSSGATLTLTAGSITGGNGGNGGASGGLGGNGGAGIVGADLTVITSGAISGGTGGLSGPSGSNGSNGNAITFTGGNNVLELRSGYSFVGNVVDLTNNGTLRLGGAANSSFDVSAIGSLGNSRDSVHSKRLARVLGR